MKRIVSLIMLFLFCFFIADISAYADENSGNQLLKKGIEYFNNAYFEKALKSLGEALTKNISNPERAQAFFYIALSYMALNKREEAKVQIKEILKIDPGFNLKQGEYPPDIESLFNDVKANYPIITNMKALPTEFYPYRGEMPFITFNLSAPDSIRFSIGKDSSNNRDIATLFMVKGENKFIWEWTDDTLNANRINFSLTPEKNNNEYSIKKTIKLDVQMPKNLVYEKDEFALSGRQFLQEYITKRKMSLTGKGILICGLCLAAWGVSGCLSENKKNHLSGVILSALGAFFIAGPIFAINENTRVKITKPNEENIKKNKILREEIEESKRQIVVKQEIIDEFNQK